MLSAAWRRPAARSIALLALAKAARFQHAAGELTGCNTDPSKGGHPGTCLWDETHGLEEESYVLYDESGNAMYPCGVSWLGGGAREEVQFTPRRSASRIADQQQLRNKVHPTCDDTGFCPMWDTPPLGGLQCYPGYAGWMSDDVLGPWSKARPGSWQSGPAPHRAGSGLCAPGLRRV